MPPITPLPPQTAIVPAQGPTRPRSAEAVAAQRAFFNAALGKAAPANTPAQVFKPKAVAEASAPIAPAGTAAPTPAPAPVSGASTPSRMARPGSVIDIKV
jgi:hypothetical protein